MKNILNKIITNTIITAILFIILGLLLIIFPHQMANLICYGIGLVLLIYGIILILKYVGDKNRTAFITSNLIVGVILCGVAIFLFVGKALLSIIALIFGLFLIIDGIMNAQKAFRMKNLGYEKWWIDFLFSVVSMAIGFLIVTKANVISEIVLGVCLLYNGIMNLISSYGLGKASKIDRK